MPISKRLQTPFVVAALFIATGLVAAAQAGTEPERATHPADSRRSAITTGQLANGLRYYIRANNRPEKRAELRLAVNAGSVLEDDDQRGLAHFVEHMAFNGTKQFPKQDIVKFLESIGMRFGAHLNAYTSFDETVYMLQVPTDKPEVAATRRSRSSTTGRTTSRSIQPRSTRSAASCSRSGGSAAARGARMLDKQFPVLFKGSRYAERLPIGKPEILETFKHDRLTLLHGLVPART